MDQLDELRAHRRLATVVPTVLVLAALLLATILGLYGLSAARAYVGAEGLWSRAAARALQTLERYGEHRASRDLERFEQAIRVTLAMREARRLLDAPQPLLDDAARAFVAAGIAPEDATLMCYAYLLGRSADWTASTVSAWAAGDAFIERLTLLAQSIPAATDGPAPDDALTEFRQTIAELSDRFAVSQRRFSDRIAERSRWLVDLSVMLTSLLACGLGGAAVASVLRSKRHEENSRAELGEVPLGFRLPAGRSYAARDC